MVTKEMIGAAHDICLKKGDFVLSANLLERIYLAMRDKVVGNDTAGWDAYEALGKASDERVLELRTRVAELEAVLVEARSALLLTQEGSEFAACLPDEWSFAADKDWNRMHEAIAKIDEVLK